MTDGNVEIWRHGGVEATEDMTTPPTPRRGRRPSEHTAGENTVREQIIVAATAQFGAHGYPDTTIRKIGEAAGVDAKLVHYYFGTKEDLFTTAISEVFRSRGFLDLLTDQTSQNQDSPGVRYLLAVFTALENPSMGPAFVGLIRSLGTHEESRRIFLRFIGEEVFKRLSPLLNTDRPETRIALAGSHLLGLTFARYVLKIPPVATLSISEVAHTVGPAIDRYLQGDLDWDNEGTAD